MRYWAVSMGVGWWVTVNNSIGKKKNDSYVEQTSSKLAQIWKIELWYRKLPKCVMEYKVFGFHGNRHQSNTAWL